MVDRAGDAAMVRGVLEGVGLVLAVVGTVLVLYVVYLLAERYARHRDGR